MKPITDRDTLRAVYGEPHDFVRRKQIPYIDDGARSFIARSPFLVVATAGSDGCDASPRGGPPGFVAVLDDRNVAFGDLSGNNLLDSFGNLLDRPAVGLLFLVPDVDETLRVNGRATLSTDPGVLAATAIADRPPRVAVCVEVSECYIHCAKAVRRAGLWDRTTWPPPEDRPSAAQILKGHVGLDVDASVIEADLEAAYQATLWEAGGEVGVEARGDFLGDLVDRPGPLTPAQRPAPARRRRPERPPTVE